MLRGVDLNSYKADLNLASIAFDFAIVKATGGNGYVNPHCDIHVQQAIALGKKWGVYHYFSDGFNDGDPIAEANWFVDNCAGYVGKGILGLDWERGGNPDVGNVGKALAWLQHVEARTGVKPVIYMSLSLISAYDWSSVIFGGYGLWCADYVENNTPIANYSMDPNRDPNPRWDGNVNDVLWQFTSTGRIDGYGGNLDCSFFYGAAAAWDAYAGTHTPQPAPELPAPPAADTPVAPPVPVPPTPEPAPAPVPVPEPAPLATPQPDPTVPVTPPTPQPTPTPHPVVVTSPTPLETFWAAVIAFLKKLFTRSK